MSYKHDEALRTKEIIESRKGKKQVSIPGTSYLHPDSRALSELLGKKMEICYYEKETLKSRTTFYVLAKSTSMLEFGWFWSQSTVIGDQLEMSNAALDDGNLSVKLIKVKNYHKFE